MLSFEPPCTWLHMCVRTQTTHTYGCTCVLTHKPHTQRRLLVYIVCDEKFAPFIFWSFLYNILNDNVILSTHIDTIRAITSIVLVCLFINFAAAKFFSILSKNDSVQTQKDSYEIRRDNS